MKTFHCLLGFHDWRAPRGAETGAARVQQCRDCGKARICDRESGQWLYGDALPPLDDLPGMGNAPSLADGSAADGDTMLTSAAQGTLSFRKGGGAWILFGVVVGATGLFLATAPPDPSARLLLGGPLCLAGYIAAAWRSGVEIDAARRTVLRWWGLPAVFWRREHDRTGFEYVRVAWEPRAPVLGVGPGHGPAPRHLVRLVGPAINFRVANTYEATAARRIAQRVGAALQLPVEDRLPPDGPTAPGN